MSVEIARLVGFVMTWAPIAMIAIEVLNIQGAWLMFVGNVAGVLSMAAGNWAARMILR